MHSLAYSGTVSETKSKYIYYDSTLSTRKLRCQRGIASPYACHGHCLTAGIRLIQPFER